LEVRTMLRASVWLVVVVFAYVATVLLLQEHGVVPLRTGDDALYENVSVLYINGSPPLHHNPEHPPLAKYIIGLCMVHEIRSICPSIAVAAGIGSLGYALYVLTGSVKASVVYIIATAFEPLFISLGMFNLLDPYMLLFTGLAVTAAVKEFMTGRPHWLLVAGVLWGAAVASKLPSMYLFAGVLLWYSLVMKSRGKALTLLVTMITVFTLSFIIDLKTYGVQGLLDHFRKMYVIMNVRHGFEPFLAINGLLYFILQLEIWRYIGQVDLVFRNGTLVKVTYRYLDRPLAEVTVTPYMHSYLHVYAVTLLPGLLRGDAASKFVSILALFSLAMLIYGPLWWYLVLPSAMLHFVLAYTHRGDGRLAYIHVAATLILWAVYLTLGGPVRLTF